MSLEQNHINIERLGLGFEDNGHFVIESENYDSTAEFIGKSGRTTVVFKTPDESNVSHNFMIRTHDFNILSIESESNLLNSLNDTIIDISEEKVCVKRPLCIMGLMTHSNANVDIGSRDSPFRNVYSQNFEVDGFRFYGENDTLYNQNINTSRVSEFAYIQPFNWYSIEENDDKVYLDGDLIIMNDTYLNGNIYSNVDLSDYKVNNLNIDLYTLGTGLSLKKHTSPTVENVVINDAWTPILENNALFSKRTLIVNGNIYIGSNLSVGFPTTTYRYGNYTGAEYVYGNNAWSNVDEDVRKGVYVDIPVYVDGDIISSGNIIRNFTNDFTISKPLLPTNVDSININDRYVSDDYNTTIYNEENINIEAKNITIKGALNVEGGFDFNNGGVNLLKEIYEHSAVYNSMDVMQKRYTYTGQMPIGIGYKHEIGYDITWITDANATHMFEIRGNIFMSDTLRSSDGGLRIRSDFLITIDPRNNNNDLPGLDEKTEFTHSVSSDFVTVLDLDVVRKNQKHVKLFFKWETQYQYNEIYTANINIEGFIPAVIGKNMLFTPFHNVLEGGDGNQEESSPYFANIDNEGTVEVDSNIRAGVISKLYISGDDVGPALKVEQPTINNETSIAEFWDKNSGLNLAYENDTFCPIDHYGKPYGVRFGAGGVTGIGVSKDERTYLDSSQSAQLNVRSFLKDKNAMQVSGYYGNAVFDNGGRLIIGSKYKYNERNNVSDPAVKNYALDVVGDVIFDGALSFSHNGMLKSFFNMTDDISETNISTLTMYLSWITDNQGLIPDHINNIYLNGFYQITSFEYINSEGQAQEHNLNDTFQIIINPHDNGLTRPNRVRDWSSITVKSQLFRIFEINVNRQDYNAIRIDLVAKTKGLEIVKSRASADISVSGDKQLGQFNLQDHDNYFGIIHNMIRNNELENHYYLIMGTYTFNVFNNFILEDETLVTMEYVTCNIDSNVLIEFTSSNFKIETNLKYKDYSIQLNVLNRESNIIDDSVIYNITELPEINILGDSNINISNLTSNIYINLYDYYELSTFIDYSNIKDYIGFEVYNTDEKNIFNDSKLILGEEDVGSNYKILTYYKNYDTITKNVDLSINIY
tara:strand:+ start:2649 stop:5939 length:3291 start_codon:yes stop_codon:yes gene_type:complete